MTRKVSIFMLIPAANKQFSSWASAETADCVEAARSSYF